VNIIIIEDELLTAEDLAETISSIGGEVNIQAVLHSVGEAIRYFRKEPQTDLIFSDIQLGDGLSFEIFNAVRIEAPIIFCTAYNEFALEAIRNNGIEYLLKPFTRESVVHAIDRYHHLKKHFSAGAPDYEKLIYSLIGKKDRQPQLNSILVQNRDKIIPIDLSAIALIYIDGPVNRLHCFNGQSYIVGMTLDELEEGTGMAFFRANRQYLINRKAVRDATYYVPRKYVVNLHIPFKEAIVISKNRTGAFLQWLSR
jgi:DNA-binding LytR/AlgR family response regulator